MMALRTLAMSALAACSLTVDTSTTQCTVDADCEHFGSHPSCQAGVCVSSGLGPPGCFFGTPMQQSDFRVVFKSDFLPEGPYAMLATLPDDLRVTAEADGLIMALSHKSHPVHGVQFHPESIASEHGHLIFKNFLDLAAAWNAARDRTRADVH